MATAGGGEGGMEMRERPFSDQDVELSKNDLFDDDGKPKRTGTVLTGSAHIVTAVIGSGVLSLAWSMAQLGWIVGCIILIIFAMITYYMSTLLADSYRSPDPVHGKRNPTYKDAVKANLSAGQVWFCGICQYMNLVGTCIGYTITASISAAALVKASCFHKKGHNADCSALDTYYMVGFGIIQLFLSQLPNFHELWWLSIVAAVMSITYSLIAIGLSAAQIITGPRGTTTITGTRIGVEVDAAQKVWNTFQALGDVAFAYSYSMLLIEIQDTLKSDPPENKSMKKASLIGVSTTTAFYFLCGCLGYAAFGNKAPGNILTGFGFYEPFWLVDIGNIAIVIHLVGAFQIYSQPIYAVVELCLQKAYPNNKLITTEKGLKMGNTSYNFNVFRLIWRSFFVILCTFLAILLPFFNDILGFLGSIGFWPLTVYFPIEMHIAQNKIARFSRRWILLQMLSMLCMLISVAAAVSSIEGVVDSLKHYTPFKTKS